MLFEPCGDLRKDYGAFCETLRLTEREEVYSALRVTPEHVVQEEASASAGDADAARTAASPETADGVPASSKTSKSRMASTAGRRSAAHARGGSVAAAADPTAAAATAAAADLEPTPALTHLPALTFVVLRHPTFCINQRDVTPLCRAMPHCPSLVSVQLTGCGLSVEAFMLLVEAVYRSRRVLTVEVDFNAVPQPGFLPDPTIAAPAPATPPPPLTSGPSTPRVFTVAVSGGPFSNAYEEGGGGAAGGEAAAAAAAALETSPSPSPGKGSRKSSARSRRSIASASKRFSKKASDAAAAAAEAAEAAAAALAAADEPGALYLKPTEFCGLHLIPTPLEELVAEERDKKGKADPKKVTQLQAQVDAMHEFDRMNRRRVPRGWHGMLYTAVRYLSLRGNGIGDDAVGDMVDAILANPFSQITSLNLWGNSITDSGAAHLARLLSSCHTLRALDVGRNRMSDEGVLALVECFRVREVSSIEDLHRYRYAVLSRPSASTEERHAAALSAAYAPAQGGQPPSSASAGAQQAQQPPQQQPPPSPQPAAAAPSTSQSPAPAGAVGPAAYPSYQDLYRMWHAAKAARAAAAGPTLGGPASGQTGGEGAGGGHEGGGGAVAGAGAVNSSTGSARKAAGAKAKGARSEAPPPVTTFQRPTLPFDRDCVRVLPTADSPVRVPGNMVLEVLNVGGNALVTPRGAREVARILSLHEPRTDGEMVALVSGAAGATPTAALPPLNAVVEAPALHCAGLRLRSFVVFAKRYTDEAAASEEMAEAQRAINAALDTWAPPPPAAAPEAGQDAAAAAGALLSAASSCVSPRMGKGGDAVPPARAGGSPVR